MLRAAIDGRLSGGLLARLERAVGVRERTSFLAIHSAVMRLRALTGAARTVAEVAAAVAAEVASTIATEVATIVLASTNIVCTCAYIASALQAFATLRTLEMSGAVVIVATIEPVAHTEAVVVGAVTMTSAELTSVIPAASAVHAPAVSTVVGHVEVGTTEVEIGAIGIAGIDAEVPVASLPIERTIEITCLEIGAILPVEQDIAEVEVTTFPIDAVKVGLRVDIHQIVEVDLVGSLVLFLGQVELIRHLVGKEESLLASLFVTHGVGLDCESEQCCEGDD